MEGQHMTICEKMLQFLLVVLFAACTPLAPQEFDSQAMPPIGSIVSGSPVTVTPDATPVARYASITVPGPATPVLSADIQALGLQMLNIQENAGGSAEYSIASMQARTDCIEGTRSFVPGFGWYFYVSGGTLVGNSWSVLATGMGVGRHVHELFTFADPEGSVPRIAAVGPFPGDANPASAGRIHKSLVPWGIFSQYTAGQSSQGISIGPSDPLTGANELAGFAIGDVAVGDVVKAHISGAVQSTSDFVIGTWFSQDNGATYQLKSPRTSATIPVKYALNAAGDIYQKVDLDFTWVVTNADFAGVSIRAYTTPGATTLNLQLGSVLIEVTRP